jgi:hypothetical protein
MSTPPPPPPTNVAGKPPASQATAPPQQFVPLQLNALPVPPPPIINGKPVRLMIAVPATPIVDWRWSFWFSQLRMQFPTAMIAADNKYGIAQSREALLNQFNAVPDATHMLFVDTDIIAPDYGIYTLLSDMANPDVEIVSGIYFNSLFTGLSAWVDEKPFVQPQLNPQNNNGLPLWKVDKCGFGFTLISKELMKKLLVEDRPMFYYKISDGALHSEDFYFAAILKKLKIPMYIDSRVQCQHIKTMLIHPNGQATM